ncbi:hypothetical protein SAMN05660226_02316 [Parapedobacter luteus]|uniref:Uncharacterized protein n=1 Tax=Parapedobacter luteus TaxID=623280 RepID=A0A1T5CSY2_9SPHI|nr:hypothetical protein [Parapedobacter luteus]SKB62585.1 hypothetical protein SAMN05660226_02316 [Parapedobacter luteus]
MMKRVTSIAELKMLSYRETGEYVDFCMMLAGGLAKSYKRIGYDPETDTFGVYNMCDDTEQEDLDDEALARDTLIVTAVERGALFYCEL